MNHGLLFWIQCTDSISQHCVHQIGIRRDSHPPTDRHSIKTVNDRGQIYLPGRNGKLRDICEPLFIWFIRMKITIDEILRSHAKFTLIRGWQYTFSNLEKYKDGREIAYTIKEDAIENYKSEISGDMTSGLGFTVKNTIRRRFPFQLQRNGLEEIHLLPLSNCWQTAGKRTALP